MTLSAEEWLNNEDRQCRSDRLNRLKLIIEKYPDIDTSLFHGGLKSYCLFEEARYCFVYGQYIASTMLSLSYIENALASVFYAPGRNDLQGARLFDLLKKAKEEGCWCQELVGTFLTSKKLFDFNSHKEKQILMKFNIK